MGWWYNLEKGEAKKMLLFGLNMSVGLFLEFSAFSGKIAIISFDVKISSDPVIVWAAFFTLLGAILVRVSRAIFLQLLHQYSLQYHLICSGLSH